MKTENILDVLILGAGASGLMCASKLCEIKNLKIGIIDANSCIGKKIKISGGGRCNVTNMHVDSSNYLGESAFVSHVLSAFTNNELLKFLYQNGLELVKRKKYYYFCNKSSTELINLFKKLNKYADFYFNEQILHVKKIENIFILKSQKQEYKTKRIVVATGGASYKSLNASDIGLKIASDFNIKSINFSPALVGFTLQKEQFWMKELSGVGVYVKILIGAKEIREDMLFTHRGISGPAILNSSLYWKKGDICIDFLPLFNINLLIKESKKQLSSSLKLPKRLAKVLLKALHVEDKFCSKLIKLDIEKLQKIHNYNFAPAGNFGFSKAEVSRGGVCTQEIDKNLMMSKKIKNLYFIGEVLNVTGELGGYNFQWAFSSAAVCAKDISKGFYKKI